MKTFRSDDRWGRKEKAAKGLCGRWKCQEKAEPGVSLCQQHIEQHTKMVAYLEAHPLRKPEAPRPEPDEHRDDPDDINDRGIPDPFIGRE